MKFAIEFYNRNGNMVIYHHAAGILTAVAFGVAAVYLPFGLIISFCMD